MPSVGPMSAGFKQVPAGGYLTVLSTLERTNMYVAPVKTGSGGAFAVAAPVAVSALVYSSTNVTTGSLLKDMGSVVVSSSRVFRKFKAVATAGSNALGDAPSAVTSPSADFGTFYLEVAADGGDVPAATATRLARSF